MSLKPSKKTDHEKYWMTRRRDKVVRINPEYHLIVTEGTDTEPAYFESIKEIINNKYRERIHLDIFGEGDNTLSLFDKARRKAIASPNTYKHVWVVYDTDDRLSSMMNSISRLPYSCPRTAIDAWPKPFRLKFCPLQDTGPGAPGDFRNGFLSAEIR